MASKLVVIGSVNGRLKEVFNKLGGLQVKQRFAFAIIAGDLFAKADTASETNQAEVTALLNGEIEVPLPTYFAFGQYDFPTAIFERLSANNGEVCPNLTALGRKAHIKTTEGFRIVTVGGVQQETSSDEPMTEWLPRYSNQDAAAAKNYLDADILVTSDWPASIRAGSKAAYTGTTPSEIQSIAELCASLKPRYHFSTSDTFYEREPFFHDGEAPRPITRFISLAPFGNPTKDKWIYAFSLEPSSEPPQNLPAGITASPLSVFKKRKLESQQESFNTFRFANGNGDHHDHDGRRGKRRKPNRQPEPDQCYFCLSNPACETHMIGSIGNDSYLTVAKGPLTRAGTFPDLAFPGHMLIIPLHHAPTLAAIPDEESRTATITEMHRYRQALHDMIKAKSKDSEGQPKLGAVTWEISRAGGVHDHWQFLPVPVELIQKGLVEAAFKVEAENLDYPAFLTISSDIASVEEGNFFKVMLWSEALRMEMVIPLDHSFRFDLQFGRRVLSKLLGLESRAHWKDCGQTKAEEEADASTFKQIFEEFDFNLE